MKINSYYILILLIFLSFQSSLYANDKNNTALQVKELFEQRCFSCHGQNDINVMADLNILNLQNLRNGGLSGKPSIVPNKPNESLLYIAVSGVDENLIMPPDGKLEDDEITLIKTWIENGAPSWNKDEQWNEPVTQEGITVPTSGGRSPDWTNREYKPSDIWAFQPINKYPVPSDDPNTHPIDAFINQTLHEKNLSPAPQADKLTLIRRTFYNLTGLPPTPEEIESFLWNSSPDAYEKLINKLLDSQQYGEKMARKWLDVVRYADTSGFSNDFERPNAWRYRDYVIRSFNQDKPYDQFVKEQIAGDELDPTNPENLIAAGYLRMGPWEHTGMNVEKVTRQHFLDDITNNVGVTYLGQAMRCAKCHDHKFDPIPTLDYYKLQAVFAPVQFADRKVEYQPDENISSFEHTKEIVQKRLHDAKLIQKAFRQKRDVAERKWAEERGVKSVKDLPEGERPLNFYGLTDHEKSLTKMYTRWIAYFEREKKRFKDYAFSVYNGPYRKYHSITSVHEMPPQEERTGVVQPIHVLDGGALEAPAEQVTPGVISAVYSPKSDQNDFIPDSLHGRRIALANWIVDPNNTLTARVIVNRVWQMHFGGNGIVRTPNNFGKMGAKPSHPELLDYLALWFMENDWSFKKLNHFILTSETYKRSSSHPHSETVDTVDSNNLYLSYYPSRRLTAEELRDSMLAITGELNLEMGGPGIYPEINWEVAMQPRHIMGSVAPVYQPSPNPSDRNRRTIYAFRYRTLADPILEVFNQPGSETSCEGRDETTVTPQVFALFNSQFSYNRALALANKIATSTTNNHEQVTQVFKQVVNRIPSEHEIQQSVNHLQDMMQHHKSTQPVAQNIPLVVDRSMIEELTGDPFNWKEKLDRMERYQPDLQPTDVDVETRALAELCLVLLNTNEFVYIR